jgi:hypothetical protein
MTTAGKLPPKDVNRFVNQYLAEDVHFKRQRWDPLDDYSRFLLVATTKARQRGELPDADTIDALEAAHPTVDGGKANAMEFIRYVAKLLAAITSAYSERQWAQLFHGVMIARRRSEPGYVRIKNQPALAKRLDALWMTPDQLQAKYMIGRTRSYDLIHEAKDYYLRWKGRPSK